ncbi:hypothetical protein ADO04_01147 [Streptococcus parauberis]|nr:hypothetical protein AKL13_00440 [Streptococcus parauberis]KYP21205.1 hypothetical protein TN39_00363 [Streptococcus parauberis]KYP22399.1 hypothetical protein AKL14_00399 [Streptococcus parauberis]KYP24864.1 hypothetical protein ADO04_01147 [Streptococcus parauberis]KYP25841.1 hypothetical protein TP84_01216 [Streptococcus parauberis]
MNSLMKLHKGEKALKVLKFNIYCNTAKEAIAEINALMSEYKGMLIEFNVNIMLDGQKEPIDLTIDSEKFAKSLNPDDLTDETNILKIENSELREECKFLHKMLIDERRFILETFKHDVIENYRTMTYANREHEKELHRATQNINSCDN